MVKQKMLESSQWDVGALLIDTCPHCKKYIEIVWGRNFEEGEVISCPKCHGEYKLGNKNES